MTTISLSATDAILDLMPGRADTRKPLVVVSLAETLSAGPRAAPFRFRLLPRAWRAALEHRARQRELEMAFERLSETSAHLLADAGLMDATFEKAASPVAWTRALPAPDALGTPPIRRGAMVRSRRRLMDLEDRLLTDVGISRSQARDEARRPRWDAPEAWLR